MYELPSLTSVSGDSPSPFTGAKSADPAGFGVGIKSEVWSATEVFASSMDSITLSCAVAGLISDKEPSTGSGGLLELS
jgi:hypothetical protein